MFPNLRFGGNYTDRDEDNGKTEGPHHPWWRKYCSYPLVRIVALITDYLLPQHPLEIENCLLSHPSIVEVSAVGLKDERYGEVIAVFVRKEESAVVTPDGVRRWVREKLSHHLGMYPPPNVSV